ncbi:MAG: hypothetical protein ACFB16_04010 [Phormidesmis sp.]
METLVNLTLGWPPDFLSKGRSAPDFLFGPEATLKITKGFDTTL